MTPQAWNAEFPAIVQPIAARTALRAPSAPSTYFARTTFSWPARSPRGAHERDDDVVVEPFQTRNS